MVDLAIARSLLLLGQKADDAHPAPPVSRTIRASMMVPSHSRIRKN